MTPIEVESSRYELADKGYGLEVLEREMNEVVKAEFEAALGPGVLTRCRVKAIDSFGENPPRYGTMVSIGRDGLNNGEWRKIVETIGRGAAVKLHDLVDAEIPEGTTGTITHLRQHGGLWPRIKLEWKPENRKASIMAWFDVAVARDMPATEGT